MQLLRLAALAAATSVLAACSTLVPPPYSADFSALDALKKASVQKTSVATVQPRDVEAKVNKISLRGSQLRGPKGTFAQYLEDALIQDLSEISVYDANAATRIDALILQNEIDVSGFSTGSGTLQVDLTVTRDGKQRLRKTYLAKTSFESSFAGAIALPKGQSEYGNLVRSLLGNVYADPEFVSALKK